MQHFVVGFAILSILFVGVALSGCTSHFTSGGQFQLSLTEAAVTPSAILADFEAAEESGAAGDITEKAASSCAGGVCTIY